MDDAAHSTETTTKIDTASATTHSATSADIAEHDDTVVSHLAPVFFPKYFYFRQRDKSVRSYSRRVHNCRFDFARCSFTLFTTASLYEITVAKIISCQTSLCCTCDEPCL